MKISIITAVKNAETTILNCLRSVTSQKNVNFEHIVVDGMSTDGTKKILSEFQDSKISVVSEPDFGIYDAMNKGIANSKGDIIGFLNADDFYANNNVLSLVKKIFQDDLLLEACYADIVYVDKLETLKIKRYWKSKDFNYGFFSKGWCPPHPTFFARRSLYESYANFNLNYKIAADVELMMRFLEVYKIKVKYVPEVWVKMRLGGISNKNLKNIWIQNKEILQALKNNGIAANPIIFFAHKLLSRSNQYLQRLSS